MGDFEGFGLSENLDALVEMLAVEIHEIGGLVLFEAAGQTTLIVDFGLVRFRKFLRTLSFSILRIATLPDNRRQFEQWLSLMVRYKIGLGDFQCPGADPIK